MSPDPTGAGHNPWPDMSPTPGPSKRRRKSGVHDHKTPPWVRRAVRWLGIGLAISVIAIVILAVYLWRQNQYLNDLRDFRNGESERNRQTNCRILDTLPADIPLLNDARRDNKCGPGVPRDELDPEVRQQLNNAGGLFSLLGRDELERADRTRERPELGIDRPDATTAEPPTR